MLPRPVTLKTLPGGVNTSGATKGRNVVTQGGDLAEHYGEPTEDQLDELLGDEQLDDQADETDEAEDVASMDADVWTDLINHRTQPGTSASADAITALETDGPHVMAQVATDRLGKTVQVITHAETGLPHLRYLDPQHRRQPISEPRIRPQPEIDLDALGPVARAWYGATNHQPMETP